MSYIFSRALAEASLPENSWDIDAFAPLKLIPTPKPCLLRDKTTEHLSRSRFGMTFELLTEANGAELLTWWLAAFRAKTSVLPEKAQGLMAIEAVCGRNLQGSFAKYSHDSSSWKTAQCSLLADSDEFSETWPRWGSMRNGASYLRRIPELHICVNESGLWPTPCATDTSDRQIPKYVHITANGIPKHIGKSGELSQMRLSQACKMWPTPTVCGNYNRKGLSKTSGDGLATAVKKWPTPTVNDSKNSTLPPSQIKHDNIPGALLRTGETPGGQLNPNWVEWLMGWPIGLTDLKPLATDRYQSWLQQHGSY